MTDKIAIASEHAGFALKEFVKAHLEEKGLAVDDLGAGGDAPIDYPDIAVNLAKKVASGEYRRGIVICGTGVGMTIAAGAVPGARAALCSNEFMGKMCVAHNNANILGLGGWVTGTRLAAQIVDAFLAASFEGGRHARRVGRIEELQRALWASVPDASDSKMGDTP